MEENTLQTPKSVSYIKKHHNNNNPTTEELMKFVTTNQNCQVSLWNYVDHLYSTMGEFKLHIVTNCHKLNLMFENDEFNGEDNGVVNEDSKWCRKNNLPTYILKWGYYDNNKNLPRAVVEEMSNSQNILFKFTKLCHQNFMVHTLTIDAEYREKMDRSKIYLYSIILPVYLLMDKHVRVLVEYNDTITEIIHYMGDFKNRIVHLRGCLAKSLRNENVLHFAPDVSMLTHDEYTSCCFGERKTCCISPPCSFLRIESNERPKENEKPLPKYEVGVFTRRKNIIIPYMETASKRVDDLLRHCRYAKYDKAQIIFIADIIADSQITTGGGYFVNEKIFNSLNQFERAMKDSAFLEKCRVKQDWFSYISFWPKKLKSKHYLSTKIVLFENDFQNLYKRDWERNEGPNFNSMNCIWDIIQTTTTTSSSSSLLSFVANVEGEEEENALITTRNVINEEEDDYNIWSRLNPNFKLSIGWYSQIRLWQNDSVKVYDKQHPVSYFLKSHPSSNEANSKKKKSSYFSSLQKKNKLLSLLLSQHLSPNIPFISSNIMNLGVLMGDEVYRSPHFLAIRLYDVVKMNNKDQEIVTDDFFFSLCRMPEGWIREFILYFLHVISIDKSNRSEIKNQLLLRHDKECLLKKLLYVSQIRDLELDECDQLSNVLCRTKFLNKNFVDDDIFQ